MFCQKCGKEIVNGDKFCRHCGSTTISNEQYEQQDSWENSNIAATATSNDKVNHGLNILGWFVPLFGIIYGLIKKENKPVMAKSLIKISIISIIAFPIICGLLIAIIVPVYNNTKANKQLDEVDAYLMENMPDEIDDSLFNHDKKDANNLNNTAWTKYELTINGKVIQMPCTYGEFKQATGMEYEDYHSQSRLEPKTYSSISVYGGGTEISLYFYNLTDDEIPIYDATIGGCSVRETYEGAENISLYPGIKVGMTNSQIIEMLGEPDGKIDPTEENSYRSYSYYKNNDKSNYEDLYLEFSDGTSLNIFSLYCIANERSLA